MINSAGAATAFQAAAGSLGTVDFESSLPGDISIGGGTTTNNAGCNFLCGFNTTAGGAFFREILGNLVTFSFTNPVNAFGLYVTDLQAELVSQQTISYIDGASVKHTIIMPSATGGGGAFVGFIDASQLISSITFDASGDVVGLDDVQYGKVAAPPGAVPEPSTLALFGVGFAGIASLRRRRRQRACAV